MKRAKDMPVAPPILLEESGTLEAFDLRSGPLNYGGMSDDGSAITVPLDMDLMVSLFNLRKKRGRA